MNTRYPSIRLQGISKRFGGIRALDCVDFEVGREIHALVGHNGAGKSTLVKILMGAIQPDEGIIEINGKKESFVNPGDAQEKGISMVWQELVNFPNITVAENILIGRYVRNGAGGINWNSTYDKAEAFLQRIDLSIDPRAQLSTLSLAEQQLVEFAKALSFDPTILIMDEPTSALPYHEQSLLYDTVLALKEQDLSIIYITHKMDEIFSLPDRITVMRDGKRVLTEKRSTLTVDRVIEQIIGRDETGRSGGDSAEKKTRVRKQEEEKTVLEVRGLNAGETLWNINFSLHQGEILALSGLTGSGISEIGKILFGAALEFTGEILIEDENVAFTMPQDAVQKGLGYLPKNRKEEGLIPKMSLADNVALPSLRQISGPLFIKKQEMKELVEPVMRFTDTHPLRMDLPAVAFSGGNQQKIVFSRWIARNTQIMILDEPTRGVDVGAIRKIYELIQDMANKGCSIIVLSSEFEEIHPWMDRIIVMSKGQIVREVDPRKVSWKETLSIALRGNQQNVKQKENK